MKSEYKKQQEKKRILSIYVCLILLAFIWFFAGKVQQACIEANGVEMCD